MKAKPWEILKKEKLLETRIFDIEKRRCRSRVQEKEADFFVLDSGTWVNIAAVTEDENIILIKQYRAGTDEVAFEIPGGICEPGEDPADAGLRELKEEGLVPCSSLPLRSMVERLASTPSMDGILLNITL